VVLLEALSGCCAVITTDIESCREVVGDAALFVKPECPEDIRTALERLLADPVLRYELGSKAVERVKRFSWAQIAAEYLQVYAEVSVSR
jgi:glycosyltransferase involved in cell wall biosynthesis